MKTTRKQNKRKKEWFDNDAFWRDLYPFMFPDQRFADAPREVEKLLSLVQPKGKRALDLCCGPGRCAIALALEGFSVTGVDRTGYLLERAKAGAKKAKAGIEWVQMDMRDFIRPGSYSLAISMFTSFGYFNDKREDSLVLGNIFASLKSGGACVIDVMGKEILARKYQPTTSEILPDGTKLICRHEIFDDWTRVRNEWILVRNGRARTFRFHHTIYSGQELRLLLEQAGFAPVRLYGNMDGDDYGPDARRLIAVGVKPQ
jgi:SAM-dependent methyltransferase